MPGAVVLERALGLFVLAQITHIACWRWRRPSGYLFWFLKAWLVAPTLCILAWLVGRSVYIRAIDWENSIGWLGTLVGYIALCGAYVMIYPAIAELSPSLEIMRQLRSASNRALPVEAIKIVTSAGVDSVRHRVQNLEASGLIAVNKSDLTLTQKGQWIAAVLSAYRALLGIKRGAGG